MSQDDSRAGAAVVTCVGAAVVLGVAAVLLDRATPTANIQAVTVKRACPECGVAHKTWPERCASDLRHALALVARNYPTDTAMRARVRAFDDFTQNQLGQAFLGSTVWQCLRCRHQQEHSRNDAFSSAPACNACGAEKMSDVRRDVADAAAHEPVRSEAVGVPGPDAGSWRRHDHMLVNGRYAVVLRDQEPGDTTVAIMWREGDAEAEEIPDDHRIQRTCANYAIGCPVVGVHLKARCRQAGGRFPDPDDYLED